MFDTFWPILILGCATWRLSFMLLVERGPFDFFVTLRESFDIDHDEDGEPIGYPDTFFGNLFACVNCLSVWVGGTLTVVYLLHPLFALVVSMPFCLSAFAILIDTAYHRD